MEQIIVQRVHTLPGKVIVSISIVDAFTGEILHAYEKSFYNQHLDDVMSASLASARSVGRMLRGTSFVFDVK